MNTLQGLGWKWRTDGVEVCVLVDGKRYEIFVPLARVWHEFSKALAENGTPLPASVSGHMTVAGLLNGIACAAQQPPAVGWFGSKIAHAVSKAASAVTHAAVAPVTAATHALSSVPVFGHALSAATTALTSPVQAVNALAQGGKISTVAMNALKQNISSMRTLAPYAQTVISVVPGVGQGLSGAIGAGLALASGMSINDAVMAGVRDSLPGGPLARAAFDVATAAAQGKPISQVALAALPISPDQKQVLLHGVQLAQDLGKGKNVSRALVDAALNGLPPAAAKAVQIASALAHAKSLQQVIGGVAQAAGVSAALANGVAAANHLLTMPRSLQAPPHLIAAVQQGLRAKQLVANATNAAAQGHTASQQFLSFLSRPHISGPFQNETFTARFHTSPAHPQHHGRRPGAGIHRSRVGVGAPLENFTARFHENAPSVSGPAGIHRRFHGEFSYPSRPVAQLYPVRMPYQTPARLHYAYGR